MWGWQQGEQVYRCVEGISDAASGFSRVPAVGKVPYLPRFVQYSVTGQSVLPLPLVLPGPWRTRHSFECWQLCEQSALFLFQFNAIHQSARILNSAAQASTCLGAFSTGPLLLRASRGFTAWRRLLSRIMNVALLMEKFARRGMDVLLETRPGPGGSTRLVHDASVVVDRQVWWMQG